MIINLSLYRLSLIILILIFFPLIQKQWLNLYLFDINNFSIYKVLYYLSGLFVPILVCLNSINKFTHYKFNYLNKKNQFLIKGKLLLIITAINIAILSILISNYVFINIDFMFKFFFNDNNLAAYYLDKQIFPILIISILLILKKTIVFLKKFILINFLTCSAFIWYSQINNILISENFLINKDLDIGNINSINTLSILAIEIGYYFWSYISYRTNLSDWNVPMPNVNIITPIFKIIIFYLLIIIYYSILST